MAWRSGSSGGGAVWDRMVPVDECQGGRSWRRGLGFQILLTFSYCFMKIYIFLLVHNFVNYFNLEKGIYLHII